MKAFLTSAVFLMAGNVFSGVYAHAAKAGEQIKDYVSHAELSEAVEQSLAQREEAKSKEAQTLQEKRSDELRRERFFNRMSRER